MTKILLINPKSMYLNDFLTWIKKSTKDTTIEVTVYHCSLLSNAINSKIKLIICLIRNFFAFASQAMVFKKTQELYDSILLNGIVVAIPYLLLAKLLFSVFQHRKVIIIHFYLHNLAEKPSVKKILTYILDRKQYYLIVQSDYEKIFYETLLSQAHVEFIPYCQNEIDFNDIIQSDRPYVFSGGYTNRDYISLVKAATENKFPLVIIKSRLNQIPVCVESGIKILEDVDRDTYYSYVKHARIVVVPLKDKTGSSGQMLALAAMSMKKPVVYPRDSTVSHYFVDGVSGIEYEMANVEDLAVKLKLLLGDEQLCVRLGLAGYDRYRENYSSKSYYEQLFNYLRTDGYVSR
ncbi:MAG: glycosyltransferase [Gammaproteobacteria bacterium]